MKAVYALLEQVRDSDATVLVVGESGTGKELVARAVHDRGRRSKGPFVAVNCVAIPESLLESEFFGHVRGAFTDAKTARRGLFAEADGGTLFLDEIGEMPVSMQAKLLRALQERKARPVGGNAEVGFDVRIVCATNRDLEAEVAAGRFREDLFYRLNVIRIDMPSLNARGNDILLLAQFFIDRFASQAEKSVVALARPAAEKLLAYCWAGNVRELQNCIERAVALTAFDQITIDDLPDKIRNYQPNSFVLPTENPSELISMAEVEKRYILQVMQSVSGNKALAAKILGIEKKALQQKLEGYGDTTNPPLPA
jgi:two-component system response regulator HydG